MEFATGKTVGDLLCDMFGIDSKEVVDITVHAPLDGMAIIELKKLIDFAKVGQVTKYFVVEKSDN